MQVGDKNADKKNADNSDADAKADPEAFVNTVNGELLALWNRASAADWAQMTDITDPHEKAAAEAKTAVMAYETKAIGQAAKFDGVKTDPAVGRQIQLLKLTSTLPAPNDDAKRKELAGIASKLEGMYGKGKWCKDPADAKSCLDLGALSSVMATHAKKGTNAAAQLEAWERWRTVSVPMRSEYKRFVELGNEGAKAIGFSDVGELWKSRYDMTPDAFDKEMQRLWGQVKPLYEQLHCHVRAGLNKKYGDVVPLDGKIPAHLVGNMWAQEWSNLYDWLEPYPGEPSLDVTAALVKAGYDEVKMVKAGESFFTSLGLNALPASFWERSMLTKPKDKEVVCHASAWDVTMNNDLRIKMCIKIDHEDFVTIHHELGHIYYYNNYYKKPVLFQSGAHDGFHEAIGDAIALSITPGYLKKIGLLTTISENDKGIVNKQMQDALSKIAFLPFGKMIDQWRWDVFSGKIKPEDYNAGWWKLREQYQGVAAPLPRSEESFDPGAKYHIPANTPYARYFLAHILQFQFHKAMCDAAGHTGPLHTCSIYESKAAGEKLAAMLAMGSSAPWPDALEKLTGTRTMDASALLEYFTPLQTYLAEQNKDRKCGW
ncbi:MAG: M2 family metallopeptidase [Nannocystaceae bacterium]|nr:M2 family metallopeptidase [Nannocystaceae bacterium]